MSETTPPIIWQYDGDNLVPASGFWRRVAAENLVVGERYRLVEENERSEVSHRHEFAWLRSAYASLPDELVPQYPSVEHLRKQALIDKGYCTMKQHVCQSKAEAERLERVLSEERDDPYMVIVRRRNVVTTYRAVSQSKKAMGAPQFQQSKQDIIEYVAKLIGVDPETLGQQSEAA
jgi:hypothetical protein